jgi:hypothetical protein
MILTVDEVTRLIDAARTLTDDTMSYLARNSTNPS